MPLQQSRHFVDLIDYLLKYFSSKYAQKQTDMQTKTPTIYTKCSTSQADRQMENGE